MRVDRALSVGLSGQRPNYDTDTVDTDTVDTDTVDTDTVDTDTVVQTPLIQTLLIQTQIWLCKSQQTKRLLVLKRSKEFKYK